MCAHKLHTQVHEYFGYLVPTRILSRGERRRAAPITISTLARLWWSFLLAATQPHLHLLFVELRGKGFVLCMRVARFHDRETLLWRWYEIACARNHWAERPASQAHLYST